jgi:hypothetical protein
MGGMTSATPTPEDEDGEFDRFMDEIDPHWRDRETTEMDIWEGPSPVKVGEDEDGNIRRVVTVTSIPEPRKETTILHSEVIDA